MASVGELRDDISRLGAALEAGQRGPAMGGEALVAFGVAFLPLALTAATSAYGLLSPYFYLSPLAALGGFLSFLFLVRGKGLAIRLLVAAGVAIAGQIAWFVALAAILATAESAAPPAGLLLVSALPLVMLALVFAGAALSIGRLRAEPGARAPGNRAIVACWLAIVGAAAVLTLGFAATGLFHANFFGFMLLPTVLLSLWGAGWAASAWISGRRWMGLVALGSFALALYYSAMLGIYSTFILSLALLVLAPGIKLLREAGTEAEDEA